MPYDLGGVVPLDFQAVDVSGAPANATSISLTVTTPDGATTALTPNQGLPPDQTGSGTGWYYYDYVTTQVGRHTVRWVASGTPGPGVGVGARTDAWDVKSGTDSTIIGLADAKRRLRVPAANTQYDDDIREYLEAVTWVVEKIVGPVVVQTVSERIRAGGPYIALTKPPVYQPAGQANEIISFTPVLTYGLTYDITMLTVDMDHGFVRHKAGLPFIYGPYDVVYTAGRPIIPAHHMLGSSIILRHLWGMERSGDRSGLVQPDNDVTVMFGFAIPNRALELLTGGAGPREVGGIA